MGVKREEINVKENIETLPFGSTIHRINLLDEDAFSAKDCNKNMCLIIRKGRSKDRRYRFYPNWSMEIESEQGEKVTWTPTKKLILSFIDEFLIHEARVDITRLRKSDTDIYKKHINQIILDVQKTLREFEIPGVYKKQK